MKLSESEPEQMVQQRRDHICVVVVFVVVVFVDNKYDEQECGAKKR